MRYWCGDETRVGLKTEPGRLITTKGVKPIGIMQWKRDNFYLYGLVEPLTGEHFIWEFSHLNTACFNIFLEKFSETYSQDIHILQLDNGAFHFSQHLKLPENIVLLFQPPHTPQVNPIERLWEEVKRHLTWESFSTLDELREFIWKRLEQLNTSIVASITGWDFILDALFVSGFS
ncbi:IS630 family transposase [Mastigocladopsis repens]|uniref:IS630 family transposase n=1 Tax=Mastigocladopsis repens TaxID=221287 RepID=UPI000527D98A